MWSADRASQALGMRIERIAPGEAELSMTVGPDMVNGHGICHGGYIFLLADSAFAFACNTDGRRTVAEQCSIGFLNPARCGDRLVAAATQRAMRPRSGIFDVTVRNEDGVVVAEFRGHCRKIESPAPDPDPGDKEHSL